MILVYFKLFFKTNLEGGRYDLVKCVGQDQFGNMYYEDLLLDGKKNSYLSWYCQGYSRRRWVEYADYFLPIGITGDRVPPGWHGWLAYQFDDAPPVYYWNNSHLTLFL